VKAPEALELGLIDAIVDEGALEDGAVAFARDVIDRKLPLKRVRDIDLGADEAELDAIFAKFRSDHPELFVGLKAPEGALAAIRAAATLPFDEGIVREREIAQPLTASPESAAQRHLFFAERAAQKLPAGTAKVRAPRSVQVLGEWRHKGALPETTTEPEAIVNAHADYAACRAALQESMATAVIVTAHAERLAELRSVGADASRIIGFHEAHGVAEIGIVEGFDDEAAALAMGMARALGRPAIFVFGDSVIARMLQRFGASLDALRVEGVTFADVAASMADYGFVRGRFGVDDSGGTATEHVLHRLVGDMADEAGKLQREGAVLRGSDIDFVMVKAGLWPLWRGGPAFVMEREGPETIAAWRTLAAPGA
jgi:hypothetical protein